MNPYDLPGMKRAAAKRRISPSHAPATSPEPSLVPCDDHKKYEPGCAYCKASNLPIGPASPGGEPATMEILICVGEKCGECLLCSNADLRRQLQQEQAQIRAERENWLDVMMPHHKFEIDLVLKRAETAERQLQEAREEIERLKT